MGNILVSWIGKTDTNNLANGLKERGNNGPLYAILEYLGKELLDRIVLLYAPEEGEDETKADRVCDHARLFAATCDMKRFPDITPTDPEAIYTAMLSVLKTLPQNHQLYYNLTSGTPTMHTIQLLLSAGTYPGIPLATIDPRYLLPGQPQVHEVNLPSALRWLRPDDTVYPTELFTAGVNQRVFYQAEKKVAKTDATVLILGETGVGKTVLANYIHQWSLRPKKEMITVNCAEVAGDHNFMRSELFGHKKGAYTGAIENHKGAFERADESTLFLDEVGEIPLPLQSMLLRVIQSGDITPMGSDKSRHVNFRLIAATNKDLFEEVKKGNFREDLYYRLAQYTPRLCSVREYSLEDKEKLLDFLLKRVNAKWHHDKPRELDEEARELMLRASWPGNIREMEYRLSSICLLSDTIVRAADVKEQLSPDQAPTGMETDNCPRLPMDLPAWLSRQELFHIRQAMDQCGGNQSRAAELLGLKESTLRSKLKPSYQPIRKKRPEN